MRPTPCRYLGDAAGRPWCAYHDDPVTDAETIRCYEGGWLCFEADSRGCFYHDGRWATGYELAEAVHARADNYIPNYARLEYPAGRPPDDLRLLLVDWIGGPPEPDPTRRAASGRTVKQDSDAAREAREGKAT